jgi:NADH dehydrogenase (ubiquinone) 1 beta subcomplex subunit 9
MRKRFDDNRNIKDVNEINRIVEEAKRELFLNQHPQPRKFANSPGGVAYDREAIPPDWVLDCWHPLEKARYPDYFAKREQRKKEYLKIWDSQYAKDVKDDHHH